MVGAYSAWFVRLLMLLAMPISWPIAKLLDLLLGSEHSVCDQCVTCVVCVTCVICICVTQAGPAPRIRALGVYDMTYTPVPHLRDYACLQRCYAPSEPPLRHSLLTYR